ncbi:MAG: DUF3047 domain-containing protein [Pseudomonas sp.]|uniref:DUF3047 domain-containing protein n=1 Tax=Pseudomonas sp. TaxID=306 RepID=UPI002733EAC0|nr:DUF3047 domain-containing protein [Pseudomonas sp.]MDP3847715.1 DUF3047 domain-containing protein [Pseudomonas sp.]
MHAAAVDVGRFPSGPTTPPAPWQLLRFDPQIAPTQFRLREWDGVVALEASADASMALLARPLAVELSRTPILCWRWRIDAPLRNADMATKAGDDYAARVYLTFSLPATELSLLTRAKLALARSLYGPQVPDAALNYVWDNRYPVGTRRPNAYTERAQMWVLRSGAAAAGGWVSERRDVLADTQQTFGTQQVQASLLAVGSDTDNTGEQAHAGFADLHFVPRNQPCVFAPPQR